MTELKENTTNYTSNLLVKERLPTAAKSIYGLILKGDTNESKKIRKVNPLNSPTKSPNKFFNIVIESIIHYFLYQYSQYYKMTLLSSHTERDLYDCFPRYYPEEQTRKNKFIITRMNKVPEHWTLKEYLSQPGLTEREFYKILIDISKILYFYQKNMNFVHGDFHYNNILIQKDNRKIWIIDFGFSSIKLNELLPLPNTFQMVSIYPYSEDITYDEVNYSSSIDLFRLIYTIYLKYNHFLIKLNEKINEFNISGGLKINEKNIIIQKPIYNLNELYNKSIFKFDHISDLSLFLKRNNLPFFNQLAPNIKDQFIHSLYLFKPFIFLQIIQEIHDSL